jgi:hypothetical protein
VNNSTGQRLPIADAALALGISEKTLRRRIKAGTLTGERIRTPQGFVWMVNIGLVAPGQSDQVSQDTRLAPPADLTRTVVDEVTRSLSKRIEELVRENEQLRAQVRALMAPREEPVISDTDALITPAEQRPRAAWWRRVLLGE